MIIVNTKHTPEVSIIIPTYKRPTLLDRAVVSVLKQSYSNYELLIINDDANSEQELKIFIDNINDSRVKGYNNMRQKGANGARNTGILLSQGNYICFLDDDDEWLPRKVELQLKMMQSLDQQIYGGVYCGRVLLERGAWLRSDNLKDGNLQYEILTQKISLNAGSTLMMSKEAIDTIGLFDEELVRHQEIEFLLRFFEKYKIGVVAQPLAKIYGHNIPRGEIYVKAKLIYLNKIKKYIDKRKVDDQKYIYAIHFRSLAIVFANEGDGKNAVLYLKKSIFSKVLPAKVYIKPMAYIFRAMLATILQLFTSNK